MWHENFMRIFEASGMDKKTLAEKSNLPYDTVKRIASYKTQNPTIDTLDRLAEALGCTLGDLLANTRTVVGTSTLAELQNQVNVLFLEKEELTNARDLLQSNCDILQDKVMVQEKEIELLRLQLRYKEEMIAVHASYLTLLQSQK